MKQLFWEVRPNCAAQLILLQSLKRGSGTRALTLVLDHWLFLTEVSSIISFSKICVNYLVSCSHIPSYLKLSVKMLSFLFFMCLHLYLRVKKSAEFESLGIQSIVYDKLLTKLIGSLFQGAVELLL